MESCPLFVGWHTSSTHRLSSYQTSAATVFVMIPSSYQILRVIQLACGQLLGFDVFPHSVHDTRELRSIFFPPNSILWLNPFEGRIGVGFVLGSSRRSSRVAIPNCRCPSAKASQYPTCKRHFPSAMVHSPVSSRGWQLWTSAS